MHKITCVIFLMELLNYKLKDLCIKDRVRIVQITIRWSKIVLTHTQFDLYHTGLNQNMTNRFVCQVYFLSQNCKTVSSSILTKFQYVWFMDQSEKVLRHNFALAIMCAINISCQSLCIYILKASDISTKMSFVLASAIRGS